MIDAWEALITFAKIFGLSGIWSKFQIESMELPEKFKFLARLVKASGADTSQTALLGLIN